MNITSCPQCGGRVRSVSIGWKCESCQGFIDMRGEFHQNKEEPFMPTITNMDMGMLIERLRDAGWTNPGLTDKQSLEWDAAETLSTLQAENKRLNKIVCSIPTTPDSGRTVSQYDKEMSMCAYLDDLEAENEKLREAVDKYATAARE